MSRLTVLLLSALLLVSCTSDDNNVVGERPEIILDETSARYRVKVGHDLRIAPEYRNVDETTEYQWTMDERTVCTAPVYVFNSNDEGEYFVSLKVTNSYGSADEELKVTVVKANVPIVNMHIPYGGFSVASNDVLSFSPTVENADDCDYQWTVDCETVSNELCYDFVRHETGTYHVRFTASTKDGTDEIDFDVQVCNPSDMPFSWKFPFTEINVSKGRSLKVKAYFIKNDFGGRYTWQLDGNVVDDSGSNTEYIFHAVSEGLHKLTLTMKNEYTTVSQVFDINVCPEEGTFRRALTAGSKAMANRVYEYMPAPGHQVNGYTVVGDFCPPGISMQDACDTVMNHFGRKWMVSLGGCGGYLVAGFDHSVENSGDFDIVIKGNPYSYQSEPGIIWVSQDENGDGLPNDTWYELAGSEYGTQNSIYDYAITYYHPADKGSSVIWEDNFGNSDIIPYMPEWNTHDFYWQDWQPQTELTFFGTRLLSHHTYENGYSLMPPYDWGYADNAGSDYFDGKVGRMGYYKISNAMTYDHRPANLKYIDFIKVQTAQTGWTPNLGEISTEVYYIADYHLDE